MDKERACEILGVSLDYRENAKRAYLRLCKEKHPDKGGDPEEFLLIHEAYKTLVEVERPKEFREERIEFQVKVSLEEAVFGVVVETHIRPQTISAFMIPTTDKASAHVELLTITEKIPPMALLQKPMVVVYPSKMVRGTEREIAVHYSLREHERYKICKDRSKALLSVEMPIPVLVALHGGLVEVETMFGPRKLNVKPVTNIGDRYYIQNHGPLGTLEVVISGIEMPVVSDPSTLEVDGSRQAEVEEEDRELLDNERKAREIKEGGGQQTNGRP
jgi:DnaJ-class molecular chaperone